jgi:short-subunit dehydrogenase
VLRDSSKAAAFRHRYGPTALVAGASEGIGRAFAFELAELGMHLVLVARRAPPLDALSAELRAAFPIDVATVACDLADDRAAEQLEEACRGREVGLLVYNAAASSVGPFLATPLAEHLRTIAVNARGPVLLIHRLAGAMIERGRGGVVIMSSLTAFQGTPLVALYGATKAFDLVLAEGLGSEFAERGVDVLACCAGATLTPGYERVTPMRPLSRFAPKPQDPREVAREALTALGHRPVVVTGFGNRVASFVMRRLLTRRFAVSTMSKAMKARYDPAT